MAQLVIALAVLAVLIGYLFACLLGRIWRAESVQSWVLRHTGESLYVPTSRSLRNPTATYGSRHDHAVAIRATFAAVWGSLVGSPDRPPARASSSAAHTTSACAAGPVRLDVPPSPLAHPYVEADTQLTAAAGEDPERPAAVVHQLGGAPC